MSKYYTPQEVLAQVYVSTTLRRITVRIYVATTIEKFFLGSDDGLCIQKNRQIQWDKGFLI